MILCKSLVFFVYEMEKAQKQNRLYSPLPFSVQDTVKLIDFMNEHGSFSDPY